MIPHCYSFIGLSLTAFTRPQNASIIINKIGASNIELRCRIYKDTIQQYTQWRIAHYQGVERLQNALNVDFPTRIKDERLYNETIIILVFISRLHDTTLYCGDHANLKLGVFYLRKYGKYK